MQGDLIVRGWVYWIAYGVGLIIVGGAIAVVVSAIRRPASDFGALGRWPWLVLQSLFLALTAFVLAANVLGFGAGLPRAFAESLGFIVVLTAIQQIAYLLRVVYPSPRRRNLAEEATQGEPEPGGPESPE